MTMGEEPETMEEELVTMEEELVTMNLVGFVVVSKEAGQEKKQLVAGNIACLKQVADKTGSLIQ